MEGKNRENLEEFIRGREIDDYCVFLACELFNPNNPQVDDEFMEKLLDTGGKTEDPGRNSFWIAGGKKLTLSNALPPQGTLDDVNWLSIKDLKKLLCDVK